MRTIATVVAEGVAVAVFAVLAALAANALSPRGLKLGRDYFPVAGNSPAALAPAADLAANPGAAVERRLAQRQLRIATNAEALAWHRDALREQGLFVFVDARDDAHFQAGHLPGAWQFNHYRPEIFLPTVLPVCLGALKVVVYCAGGSCEDSEFAAVMLRNAGVPAENLFVYVGGIADWTAQGQPLETGARGSGRLLPARP